uniref:Uncharacterized protein n=1 Tax=Arundo donax TaxID=35708 RepID=A0A0A9EDU3_ARUDO
MQVPQDKTEYAQLSYSLTDQSYNHKEQKSLKEASK